jgi:endoglucanase
MAVAGGHARAIAGEVLVVAIEAHLPGLAERSLPRVRGFRRVLLAVAATATLLVAPSAQALDIGISGNRLVDASGQTVRLIGVNRSGSEYACSGDDGSGGHGYGFFQGPINNRAIKAMRKWKVNAVALPLNEACWLGGFSKLKPRFTGEPYRAAISRYVARLNVHGIYVVLRLSGSGPGGHVYGAAPGDSEIPMADADHSLEFWRSVAERFRDNHGVLFHAYDEPHKISWRCARDGCPTNANGSQGEPRFGPYQAVGHQAIVDAIRSAGATQPIIVSGIDFAGDLSGWEEFKPVDPLNSLAVGWNDFDYTKNIKNSKPELRQLAASYPIVIGGFGDTDCNSDFSSRLMRFADGLGISYLAWTWNTVADYGSCSNALLGPKRSAYYSGHPSGFGRGVRKHFLRVQGLSS